MKKQILIAGGSGYLGKVLYKYFKDKGYRVKVLTRYPKQSTDVYWDGERLGEWIYTLNTSDVLINLAGKSVNCRYNKKNKKEIYDSRIKSTRILGNAIKISKTPPSLWINASTATIYSHSESKEMTEENGIIGHDFSMSVAKHWEKTVEESGRDQVVRKVLLRTSVVLGYKSEAYRILKQLVNYGLGGTQGKGSQMVSWIHERDFARGVDYIINHKQLQGPINLTAPNPIKNKVFMSKLRKHLGRPFGIHHPKFLLKIGAFVLGTESELILKSRYVIPKALVNKGFTFTYPNIGMALKQIDVESQ